MKPPEDGVTTRRASGHLATQFDTIADTSGVGLWDWDLQNDTVVHSGRLDQLSGYDGSELPAAFTKAREILVLPEDFSTLQATIAACVEGAADSYDIEFRLRCKDGTLKWVQDRAAVAERGPDGRATRIVGMSCDIGRFKQAEDTLTDRVRLADFAAELSGLGTIDWDYTTGQVRFDDRFLQMFGYTAETAAHTFAELQAFIHPDDLPAFAAGVGAYVAGQTEGFSQQLRARLAAGPYIWILTTARIIEHTPEGAPRRILAGCLNVDSLVQGEQKALQHNRQLQQEVQSAARDLAEARRTSEAMFDGNPYVNMIFDDAFQPVDCNPAALEYFGFSSKRELLENVLPIIRRSTPAVQPSGEESPGFAARMQAAAKKGYLEFESTMVFEGHEVPLYFTLKKIDYKDSFALAAYMLDMTAIKQTERALKRHEKLLQAANDVAALLLEAPPEEFDATMHTCLALLGGILGVDRAYVWHNLQEDEKVCAVQLCEWIAEGKAGYLDYGDRKFFYDDLMPGWREMLDGFAGVNGPVRQLEGPLAAFPGFGDVASILLLPIVTQGQFWGFIGFDDCHDDARVFSQGEARTMRSAGMLIAAAAVRGEVTRSLITAREDALAGSRAKTDFLSRMSHEIRTPMNAIIGMTTIARKTDDPAKMQYCLDKIDSASRQMLDLINDVLDMSKIEANKLEISPHEFDFERMIRNVFNVANPRIEEKKLNLSFDFEEVFTRKVVCDELRLSQVLINLLGNAAKFTPEGGSIRVKVRQAPKNDTTNLLHVEVQDTGIGISPEQQARLFGAFEQADSSTTRKYGGSGLGLAICKSIVRLMGGDIWVESSFGTGSRFIFEVDFRWGGQLHDVSSKLVDKQHLRALVVDDSEDVLDYFQNILGGFSLSCDTASGGSEAVAMAKLAIEQGRPYTVAFVDWQMPEMNGKETAEELKKLAGDALTIAMISVADRADVEKEVAGLGIQHILAKPVLPSTLYNTVVSITDETFVSDTPASGDEVPDWSGRLVLLVEDIEINREIIMTLLADTNIEVDTACDGVEAVEIWRMKGSTYDLILMDMQMPRLDGLAATRQIRESGLHHCENIPIIAMTANAFKEDVERCLEAGMNSHVAKPVDIDDLYTAMDGFLSKAQN